MFKFIVTLVNGWTLHMESEVNDIDVVTHRAKRAGWDVASVSAL